MIRLINSFFLAAFIFLLPACKTQQEVINSDDQEIEYDVNEVSFIKNSTLSNLMEKAKTENKILFLDFYADWCGPCKTMDNEVFNDKKISAFFNDNFINFKINGDRGVGREIANLYNIKGYPTVIFIDPKGVVLQKEIGLIFKRQLMSLAEQSIEIYKLSS